MTESEYIKAIKQTLNERYEATTQSYQCMVEALAAYPSSAALWCLRGDIIQLGDGTGPELPEALASYERAVALDPNCAEAYEEIGNYFDVIEDNPAKAESYFRKAIELDGRESAHEALADVLEQLNQPA
jgi:tetratricopeptide (TPR) repeat protein